VRLEHPRHDLPEPGHAEEGLSRDPVDVQLFVRGPAGTAWGANCYAPAEASRSHAKNGGSVDGAGSSTGPHRNFVTWRNAAPPRHRHWNVGC